MKRLSLFVILAIVGIASASARLTMPQFFQQGMVLQRGKAIPVWGTAMPQEKITVSWNRRQYTTQADTQGRWRIDLPAMKAGGPYTMQVSDESNTVLTYGDVLVGDVWICSGQSNIDVTIERVYPQYPEEIDRLNNPRIRLFRVQNETNTHGVQNDIRPATINWKPLNKENAWLFSAVGTFLGKRMYEKSGVPQGIIVNSWGGTPIEAWIPADSLKQDYPLLPIETRLYQDDKLTAAQQEAAQRMNDRWMHLLNETDPGISEQWTAESYNDATWQDINQYNLSPALFCPRACDNKTCPRACDIIAGTTTTDFIGSLWLRQHIHIDQAHAGKPARLLLGTLFDQDYTFLNGKEVGRTYYQYPPRRYNIPAGMLHEGDNILTVRFVNKQGIPHFIKEKPYMLIFGEGDTLRLSEQWKGRLGTTMPTCTNLGLSLQNLPSTLYNAVVYPLAPYAVSGIVWYQGETNTSNPAPYADYLKKMMGSWRSLWQDPQMPFCIVQLANYMAPSDKPQDSSWARLREQQRLTAVNDNRSELAVIIDLGEANDIHPLRKKEVAERIGLCMDRLVYGKKVQLSPQCIAATPVSATPATVSDASASGSIPVILTFNQPLQAGSIEELEVAGSDGTFVNAKGTAHGRTVTIDPPINNVTRVRYAWKDNPAKANLFGINGLPASPFEITVNNPAATGLNPAATPVGESATPSCPVGESAISSQTSLLPDEDGHDLWLRYKPVNKARVTITAPHSSHLTPALPQGEGATTQADTSLFALHSPLAIARQELETYYQGPAITLTLDDSMPDDDGYAFDGTTLRARREAGLLYGAYALLRQQQTAPLSSHPAVALRLLNHWDNPDGSVERGYAGESIFEWFNLDKKLITEYARANASIGINGTVLNNVNASPKMLTTPYLKEVSTIADILRPYGIKVYLSINFATPKALGDTETADPLDEGVRQWWQKKANEIYGLIPDFGGFLVKANSEGQPGPGDYHRTHADGANMLADALAPHQGIVMWRCFVYGANHKGEDRVKQAVSEFKPLDGQFRPNVILQTKNGPLDFQPREPYSPVFDQIHETPNMAELQITQEYLGQSRHLVYLAPLWKEFFTYVPASQLKGIVGVANIGKDRNWCGHHFSQANWYAFGRQAWDPTLSTGQIAREWLQQTFTTDEAFVAPMTAVMEESREACVNYMMPLGLHHIFKFDHHYGPEPDGFKADYPLEWCPVYYHKATKDSIGFDRSTTGTDAVSQYRPDMARIYNDLHTCPENLLLWFHRVPWTYRMQDGSTLWQAMQRHYRQGVSTVEEHYNTWHNAMRPYIDKRRWEETDQRLQEQLVNAREWRDTCLGYFATFAQ